MKLAVLTWLIVATSCSEATGANDEIDEVTPIAIVNVNVVPMDSERIIVSQTVLIDQGRITAIGPQSEIIPPAGAVIVDGKGGYLLPGLIDMHVHIRSADLDKYLRAGVTSVRNMWGYDELVPIMRDVDSGLLRSPDIFSLTAGFDGSPAQWPQTQLSDNPALIEGMIERQRQLGFNEIKVYQKLSLAAYDTIVAVARRKGMTFAGHMPTLVGLAHVLESGQRSIEHLGGYSTGAQLTAQAVATANAGTYNCPTLAILRKLTPSQSEAGRNGIVAALAAANAKLLVGTDSGIDQTIPGSSIHDELELMVGAGLTPFRALLGATRLGAEYLGQSANIGTIAVGKEADLVLVRANPLANIRATRDIRAVIYDGRLLH